MAIHIGNKIKQIAAKKGMNGAELSRRINTSRSNLYHIYERKTIDTGLLEKISQILDHDFFQYFTPMKAEIERLQEDNAVLKYTITLLREKNKSKKK